MNWVHERYPILRVRIQVLHTTACGQQKGSGTSMAARQIQGVKSFRKGQYDRSGLVPSRRGSDSLAVQTRRKVS